MNRKHLLLLLLCTALLFTSLAVWAQTSPGYNLEWHVVANGGGASNSAAYVVDGTVGQMAAAPPPAAAAGYVLSAGFWFSASSASVYLPAILNQ